MKVEIITPVLNEQENISKFILAVDQQFFALNLDYQILFVDDGSTDHTWSVIQKWGRERGSSRGAVRGLRLTRNFGKEAALSAALDLCESEACILLDVDLQHPPELIPQMIALWTQEKFDVVEGVKVQHESGWSLRGFFVKCFYSLFHWLGKIDLEKASDFKLLDRRVILAYRDFPERQLFFRGLVHWLGFRTTRIEFSVPDREHGQTKWSTLKLFRYAARNLISFSTRPLRVLSYLGLFSIFLSLALTFQTLWMKFSGRATDGFTTVIILILFFGGVHLAAIGLLSEYVGRIFDEVKKRPRYVIQEKI